MREHGEIEEIILDLVCEYWDRKLTGNEHHDNGDKIGESHMAMFFADMVASNNYVTQEQIYIFNEELKNQINNREYNILETYCDYGPGVYLYEAAQKAGINSLVFPFKNGVKFEDGTVIESSPYSGKQLVDLIIYCKKEYISYLIKSLEEQLDHYRKENYKFWEKEDCEKYYAEHIKSYKEFADKFDDVYIREDFKDFYNKRLNNER